MKYSIVPCIHLHHQPRKNKHEIIDNYSIARSYRENGKNRKEILLRLGQLTKDQAEGYRLLLRTMNQIGAGVLDKSQFISDINSIELGEQKNYFDCLVLNALWDKLGLDECFGQETKNRRFVSTSIITRILCCNRLLEPASKIKTIEWFNNTLLNKILGIDSADYNKNRIFRELDFIHTCKNKLERHFLRFSLKESKEKCRVFYFDGTTSWFEGDHCNLAKEGIEKTRGFYPNVVGIMMITDNLGYPIAWDVVHGNQRDTTELKSLVNRVCKDYGIEEITYCFDRGVASESNFSHLEKECESKYISGIRDNQISDVFDLDKFLVSRKKIITNIEMDLDKKSKKPRRIAGIDGFLKFSKKVYYKDLGIAKNDPNSRYIASFNCEIFKKEQEIRKDKLEKVLKAVAELNIELALSEKDRDFNVTERNLINLLSKHNVKKFFTYKLLPLVSQHLKQSFSIELSFDHEAINCSSKTDGILLYVTNHIEKDEQGNFLLNAQDIIGHYKAKYVIENSFRELKSFLDIRPFYVWTESHVKAHFDIAVIGYFINNHIYRTLSPIEVSLRGFYTLLKEHAYAIKILANERCSVVKMRKLSGAMIACLKELNIEYLNSPDTHKYLREPI